MCIRDSRGKEDKDVSGVICGQLFDSVRDTVKPVARLAVICLLYTTDAADERASVDLGGCRLL